MTDQQLKVNPQDLQQKRDCSIELQILWESEFRVEHSSELQQKAKRIFEQSAREAAPTLLFANGKVHRGEPQESGAKLSAGGGASAEQWQQHAGSEQLQETEGRSCKRHNEEICNSSAVHSLSDAAAEERAATEGRTHQREAQ